MKKEIGVMEFENGDKINVEVVHLSDEFDVSLFADSIIKFNDVSNTILNISKNMKNCFQKIKPSKVKVEFGLSIGFESGKLITLVAHGKYEANFKICLEW